MVFFPGLDGGGGLVQALLWIVGMAVFFLFFPRIMLFQVIYKMRKSVSKLEENAAEAENMFLDAATTGSKEEIRRQMDPMKNMVVSTPTGIDPAGLVWKLESLLDTTDDKMNRFVDQIMDGSDDEELKANMSMGFKGVYGTQQIYVITRHFKELIENTNNLQLGSMMQMMLPLYEEIAESQKAATEAFVNGVPIGDSVGPMIAASYMENEPVEAAEDVVYSEETHEDKNLFVLKSRGPGSRLGKYGDAIEQIVEDNDIAKIIFVDAGMRFEGEETGKVVDGTGVLMGGPGVEKYKIEEVASEHDIPLEGFVVKQSGPQASRPMHSKIYDAIPEAIERVSTEIEATDGENVLLVGVGNTVGVGNHKDTMEDAPGLLQDYWDEEEEESTSYFGLMKAFPMGGGGDQHGNMFNAPGVDNTFDLFRSLVR